jgi:hypothetical protein
MEKDNNEKPLGRADRILLQTMKKRKTYDEMTRSEKLALQAFKNVKERLDKNKNNLDEKPR